MQSYGKKHKKRKNINKNYIFKQFYNCVFAQFKNNV